MSPARRWWPLALLVGVLLGALALLWGTRQPRAPERSVPAPPAVRALPPPALPSPAPAPEPVPAEEPVDPELQRRQFDAAVRVALALENDADPELVATMCADGGRSCLHRAPLRGTFTEDDVRAAIRALSGPDRPVAGVVAVEPRPLGGTVVTYELRLEE
ncbi:MAG: hypothetical protein KC621_12030 [Myxococcales bacterium]|nr:hypothetical protein [Myxococcales bacterium]